MFFNGFQFEISELISFPHTSVSDCIHTVHESLQKVVNVRRFLRSLRLALKWVPPRLPELNLCLQSCQGDCTHKHTLQCPPTNCCSFFPSCIVHVLKFSICSFMYFPSAEHFFSCSSQLICVSNVTMQRHEGLMTHL